MIMPHIHSFKTSCNLRKKLLITGIFFFFLFTACQVSAADILFITGSIFHESDAAIRNNLESRGFEVTVVTDRRAQSIDALGRDLVIISESVYSRNLNTTFRNLSVPIIVSEPWLFADMGMTGSNFLADFGKTAGQFSVTVNNADHELAAGLSGRVSIGYRRGTLVWGVPGIEAIKIATLDNDQTRCAVFAYDKGAQMTGMLAPAKRVGFFLYRKMTSYLTPEGWALFDAAVDWALAPEPKTPISIQVVSDGSWKTCAAECPPMETISNLNFDDTFWPIVYSPYPEPAGCNVSTDEASFIWYWPDPFIPNGNDGPTEAWFRKTFELPGDPMELKVIGAKVASAGPFDIYINGQSVYSSFYGMVDGMPISLDASVDIRQYLMPGDNVIAIHSLEKDELNPLYRYEGLWLNIKMEAAIQPSDDKSAKKVLLVVGRTPVRSSDLKIKMRLEQKSYLVFTVNDDSVEQAESENMDLIIISETVESKKVGEVFTDAAVPLICLESYLYDDLKMTESRLNRDYGKTRARDRIFIDWPNHQMAAGYENQVKVTSRRRQLGWGIPAKSSNIIASLTHDTEKATIFTYDAGAPMAGGSVARARRVGMFPHGNSASIFTRAGWDLFDAAVEWATQQ